MGAQAVDYRVSKVVVCCKDCGQDVGLYPARHKCQDVVRPPLPPLPTKFVDDSSNLRVPRKPIPSYDSDSRSRPTSAASSTSSTFTNPQHAASDTSSATSTGSKWSRFVRGNTTAVKPTDENDGDSFYFNNFAAHLPDTGSSDSPSSHQNGKKLWGKVRQNEKWKQLNEKYEKPKQSAKLWGKLVQATQSMADKIPSRDDRGPESDESDWEGESHVSRILREYYEKKHQPLPSWLYDGRAPVPKASTIHSRSFEQDDSMLPPLDSRPARSATRKQKLWEAGPEPQMSQREREREELRQQRRAPVQNVYEDRSNYNDRSKGGGYDDHDHDSRSSYRRPQTQRKENEGWKMTSRSNTTSGQLQQDRSPRANPGYDDDDYASSRYLSDRRAPPSRARSPGRYNGDDMSSSSPDYYSSRYGSPPRESRDRVRGPRDIPNQFGSRYSDRGAGYF